MTCFNYLTIAGMFGATAVGIVALGYIANLNKSTNNLSDSKVQGWVLTGLIASCFGALFFTLHTMFLGSEGAFSVAFTAAKWFEWLHLISQIFAGIIIILTIVLFSVSKTSSNLTFSDVKNYFQALFYVGIGGAIVYTGLSAVHYKKTQTIKVR